MVEVRTGVSMLGACIPGVGKIFDDDEDLEGMSVRF